MINTLLKYKCEMNNRVLFVDAGLTLSDIANFYYYLFIKTPTSEETYYIVYYIHTNVSQIRNITVYVLKAGQ